MPPRARGVAAGGLGRLTLDRPEAINALDLQMLRDASAILDAWAKDPDVGLVVLDGSGDRGFCAGGDVRSLHAHLDADPSAAVDFFRAEYALDLRIATYPRPVVSLMDGVTMGGGVGLGGHAAVRVVTERSQVAMPETRIGLTPDVGGALLLGRAPGRLGEYLALTGATMTAEDAIFAGFADHLVPSASLDGLREALESRADPSSPAEIVMLFDETPEPSSLAAARGWIDAAFSADTVPEIIVRLRDRPERRARQTAAVLDALSPTALAVTLRAVRRARTLPGLRAVLEQDYGLVLWFASTQPDLREGIRARLIDKDDAPRWDPPTFDGLDADVVDAAFAFVPPVPLW